MSDINVHILSVDESVQCWGCGPTIKEADRNLRRAGGRPSGPKLVRVIVIWRPDSETEEGQMPFINQYGQAYAPGELIVAKRI